jgi:hypothetical protein
MPDVVLLDVYLGDEDGLEHVAAIRAAGFAGPLIVLSGDATFATAHRAAIAGADGYVVKGPHDVIPDLLRCLEPRDGRPGAAPEPIPVAALSYLESRALSAWEAMLVVRLAHGAATEKEIAAVKKGRSDMDRMKALAQYPSGNVYYNLSGSGDGDIDYGGSCGRTCYLWRVCSYTGYPPNDLTAIQAKAVSDDDYCDDDYIAYYDFPNGADSGWITASSYTCGTSSTSWYLLYDGAPDGNDDYEPEENMVYWHVDTALSQLNVQVYYQGPCIE